MLCLSIGFVDNTFFDPTQRENKAWQMTNVQEVKGIHVGPALPQLSEIEITPAKYEKSTYVVEKKTEQWGVATQVDEYTWTMNVSNDEKMATAEEIFSALNMYRQTKGKGILAYDQKLTDYAISRASFFQRNGSMDSHAGFQDFINNQDGFGSLGFNSLGENSSFGYQLESTHLIEWVFAGDVPHDTNQLNPEWTHVGIGVSGQAVDIIFGGRKR